MVVNDGIKYISCLYKCQYVKSLDWNVECRIGAGVPKEWRDWSFRLPAESGYEVEFTMKDGKTEKLILRPRRIDSAHKVKLVLPDGKRHEVTLSQAELTVVKGSGQ